MKMSISEKRRAELLEMAIQNQSSQTLANTEEAQLFSEYRKMLGALGVPLESASPSAISRSKAIMPASERLTLLAKLVRPAPQLSFARGASPVMLDYESESVNLRLQISAKHDAWAIMARASEAGWTLEAGSKRIESDESGRYEFEIDSSSLSNICLEKGDVSILLPSPITWEDERS